MVIEVFGPRTDAVLRLLTSIGELRAEDADVVAAAARSIELRQRAEAWAQVLQGGSAEDRTRALQAVRIVRQRALAVRQRGSRRDEAFWVAASDAALALAMDGVDVDVEPAHRLLLSAMASRVSWLAEGPTVTRIPVQRNGHRQGERGDATKG